MPGVSTKNDYTEAYIRLIRWFHQHPNEPFTIDDLVRRNPLSGVKFDGDLREMLIDRMALLCVMVMPVYRRASSVMVSIGDLVKEMNEGGAFYRCGPAVWVYDTEARWERDPRVNKAILTGNVLDHVPLRAERRYMIDFPEEDAPPTIVEVTPEPPTIAPPTIMPPTVTITNDILVVIHNSEVIVARILTREEA